LPFYEQAFDVTYRNYSAINSAEGSHAMLKKFDEDVFTARL